jgi:hypothetical protein
VDVAIPEGSPFHAVYSASSKANSTTLTMQGATFLMKAPEVVKPPTNQ